MRLPPWLLSFVFPLCTAHRQFRASAYLLRSRSRLGYGGHHDFGVNLTRIKLIATALQQKVSD